MLNFRRKLFLITILFLAMFFTFSQAVFSGEFGYNDFKDESTGKVGFKDSSGNIVIPAKFEGASWFREGLAVVQIGNKSGYINKEGKLVIPAKFNGATTFKEGLAAVQIGNKWGYINKEGKLVIPAKFNDAFDFGDGLARVGSSSGISFINKSGKVIIPYSELKKKLYNPAYFSEGLASVYISGSGYGYINKKLELVIPAKFDSASDFEGGLAIVSISLDYFKINKQGKMVLQRVGPDQWASYSENKFSVGTCVKKWVLSNGFDIIRCKVISTDGKLVKVRVTDVIGKTNPHFVGQTLDFVDDELQQCN